MAENKEWPHTDHMPTVKKLLKKYGLPNPGLVIEEYKWENLPPPPPRNDAYWRAQWIKETNYEEAERIDKEEYMRRIAESPEPHERGVNPPFYNKNQVDRYKNSRGVFGRDDTLLQYERCPECMQLNGGPKIHGAQGKCTRCKKNYTMELVDTVRYRFKWRKSYNWRKL